MSTRLGVWVGLSVLAFVAAAFALYYVKSMVQVLVINSNSMACADQAKARPSDRLAMDRCLRARGALVEDSPRPGRHAMLKPLSADPYDKCLRSPSVAKYTPKSSSWASELSSCVEAAGQSGVVTMHRNPSTGEIEYGVAH